MGIITWIIVGAVAGFVANLLMGNRDGVLMTVILGIVGAVVGGFLAGNFLSLKDPNDIHPMTIIVSVIGAIIVIWFVRLFFGGNRRRSFR